MTVSVAPGLGQPRPHRRGEARGLHVYEVGDDSLENDLAALCRAQGLSLPRGLPAETVKCARSD